MPIRRLTPSFHDRVWGRTELEPWFHIPKESNGRRIGEVWFESSEELPLQVKFLFTSQNLSVQVHPAGATTRAQGSDGQTEMWHVLEADQLSTGRPSIAAGFREPLTEKRLRDSAISGEIEKLLEWQDAAAGDTFLIPAGTVHSIGAGLVMCKIQRHSGITYRLYDYGRDRELQLDQGVRASHRGRCDARVTSVGNPLVTCQHFTVERLASTQTRFSIEGRVSSGHRICTLPADRALMVIVTHGSGEIERLATRAGEVWMVPAGIPEVELRGELTVLSATVCTR